MAHVSQKFAFGAVGVFGGGFCPLQLRFCLHPDDKLGDALRQRRHGLAGILRKWLARIRSEYPYEMVSHYQWLTCESNHILLSNPLLIADLVIIGKVVGEIRRTFLSDLLELKYALRHSGVPAIHAGAASCICLEL